ncbi:hypothetical protein GCM10025790_12380 [Nesterenkonia rhizosphaerae]|uniref:Uncharacterized protein n=1 Tax=Nesterenkonia rhizosphaerae TaxID=1348272 RepID=A0ABP9FW29_9MICC
MLSGHFAEVDRLLRKRPFGWHELKMRNASLPGIPSLLSCADQRPASLHVKHVSV